MRNCCHECPKPLAIRARWRVLARSAGPTHMNPLEAAWQAALAAEQQAAFGYGLLGPQLSGAARQLAVACSRAHQTLIEQSALAQSAAGLVPVAPQADYPTLYPVPGPRAARALAVRLETECASAWRYLYAVAASAPRRAEAPARRAQAQEALIGSAVRAARWRDSSVPFPGI